MPYGEKHTRRCTAKPVAKLYAVLRIADIRFGICGKMQDIMKYTSTLLLWILAHFVEMFNFNIMNVRA